MSVATIVFIIVLIGILIPLAVLVDRRLRRENPESDVPTVGTSKTQDPLEILGQIRGNISSLFDQVKRLPKFSYQDEQSGEEVHSDALKAQLTGILDVFQRTTSALDPVLKNLKDIQDQIIQPVNKIIEQSAKRGKTLAWLGFVAGFIGVVLTVYSIKSLPGLLQEIVNPRPPQESPVTPPHLTPNDPGAISAKNILDAFAQGAGQPYHEARLATLNLERLLTGQRSPEKVQVDQQCTALIGVLGDMQKPGVYNREAAAVATYGLSLCAASAGNWDKIRKAAPEGKDLSNTEYGFAVLVYEAEALVQNQSLDLAIGEYHQLQGLTSTQAFLSPVDFHQIVDGKSFVKGRLGDLEAQRDLAGVHIGIYDSLGGSLADALVRIFNAKGLVNAVRMQTWHRRYERPYIWYKRPSGPACDRLRELVNSQHHNIEAPKTCLDYRFRGDAAIKSEFDANSLDYLVILPIR